MISECRWERGAEGAAADEGGRVQEKHRKWGEAWRWLVSEAGLGRGRDERPELRDAVGAALGGARASLHPCPSPAFLNPVHYQRRLGFKEK